jgi:hypothetical protein
MSAPHEPLVGPESHLDSFWLPPGTVGNGLAAERWALITVTDHDQATHLLATFAFAAIPARMASDLNPAHHHNTGHPDRDGRAAGREDTRIWVDPGHYADAENVLLREQHR